MKTIAVNEIGRRIGQSHHRAVLTDQEVTLLIQMHEGEGLGYRRLSRIFEISKSHARYLCKGVKRTQLVAMYRVAPVKIVRVQEVAEV